jgi:Zn-finger nucleic acid-binding protein
MFVGSKFCPHCGAASEKAASAPEPVVPCPVCRIATTPLRLKQTSLHECPRCQGTWLDSESFRRICAEQERQADILGAPAHSRPPVVIPPRNFRYRGCPICQRLMNRYNFANASGVVIDSCAAHGVWFDRDELRQIVEFIRAGGVELAAQRERERDVAKQRWKESRGRVDPDGVEWWAGNGIESGSHGVVL